MELSKIIASREGKVITVGIDEKIAEVTRTLAVERLGAVVVMDDDGKLAGIISERDIVRALNERGAGVQELGVSDLMTRSVITCTPENSIEEIMELMTSHEIRHLPVVDGDALLGVVSILDVVKSRLSEVETDYSVLRTFMSTRIE
ncbi:MAG: CBS domain-containing protein [Proteobacteria bacterium]|nr:CBS domain-containing protein [Pseudomonadota bacterium]